MPPRPITSNTLFYGDNLDILCEYIANESVDLVYLDPPFNSNRNYNILFKDESEQDSEAQITGNVTLACRTAHVGRRIKRSNLKTATSGLAR